MHRGSAGIGGSAVDIEVQADDLRHTVDTVLGLIAEDTGQPVERIFADSLHDHWYTAAEARDYVSSTESSTRSARSCPRESTASG
jgi:ATP-dependent Clp protease protease subunit